MADRGRVHDRAILDALEALAPQTIERIVWRVARKGRDPLRGAVANGRWNAVREFEVLYTSFSSEGALAEVGYRLSIEPIWPSRIEHEMHRIEVQTERNLRFADVASLAPLGVDPARYRSFDYATTQAIAAAANFLAFDGLIVPNARFDCGNLVIFTKRAPTLALAHTEPVDWEEWRRNRGRSSPG